MEILGYRVVPYQSHQPNKFPEIKPLTPNPSSVLQVPFIGMLLITHEDIGAITKASLLLGSQSTYFGKTFFLRLLAAV